MNDRNEKEILKPHSVFESAGKTLAQEAFESGRVAMSKTEQNQTSTHRAVDLSDDIYKPKTLTEAEQRSMTSGRSYESALPEKSMAELRARAAKDLDKLCERDMTDGRSYESALPEKSMAELQAQLAKDVEKGYQIAMTSGKAYDSRWR